MPVDVEQRAGRRPASFFDIASVDAVRLVRSRAVAVTTRGSELSLFYWSAPGFGGRLALNPASVLRLLARLSPLRPPPPLDRCRLSTAAACRPLPPVALPPVDRCRLSTTAAFRGVGRWAVRRPFHGTARFEGRAIAPRGSKAVPQHSVLVIQWDLDALQENSCFDQSSALASHIEFTKGGTSRYRFLPSPIQARVP
ncbi:MAG: hypothetical protein BJ554DRAFT_4225 [Olpidium bornovanus]|uniref:Uncharacterized protein n=1 Tax=Olpidium bornovanus TaxID=278681 RepID=A0A8H7ZN14_9FUNG|nr:MAG: hypothetical protein BJ554DRAFT_4225 [Olpidium bornovanus]